MTQHKTLEVYTVDNIRSLYLKLSLVKPSATSIEFIGQHAFIVAHVAINMNSHKR